MDQALLQLIHQNVHSLENEVRNWSDEVKAEREKVQQQLQKFDDAFEEINQRLLRLETGLMRSRKDQERLESHSRDVEQRVTRCEGTLTSKKKKVII